MCLRNALSEATQVKNVCWLLAFQIASYPGGGGKKAGTAGCKATSETKGLVTTVGNLPVLQQQK